MFKKHYIPQVRYGVCVLQADEPKDCPCKVKLFIRKQRGFRLGMKYYYRKVVTFRFSEESDRGPFTCISQVTCMDLEPLFRTCGRWREGTEMKFSVTRRGGGKTTICLLLENFMKQLASRGQHNKKFILHLSEEGVVVENVLTLPGEVNDECKGEPKCQEEEEQSKDESVGGENCGSDNEQEACEGTEEVQRITEGEWDQETEKEMEENETEETKEDETAIEGRTNKRNTHTRIETHTKTERSTKTISEMEEDDESQCLIKRGMRKSNEEDEEGVKETPSPQESSGSDEEEVSGDYFRFTVLVSLLMVVLVVLVLSLLKHDER